MIQEERDTYMNYAFYIDLGGVSFEQWYGMYTAPENAAKREGWWGPEHVGKAGDSSVVILAQISDEEKLTQHMKFVRELSAQHGMKHEIYKVTPDGR